MKTGKRSLVAVIIAVTALLALIGAASAQDPTIPWDGSTTLPDYIGAPAKAHPLANTRSPQNPYMAPNPYSHPHNDTWNSDSIDIAAPLGLDPVIGSSTLTSVRTYPNDSLFNCGTMAIDSHGRPLLSCMGLREAKVVLADKDTLQGLAAYPIPLPSSRLNALGAFYFFLNNQDQFVIATYPNQIWVLQEGGTEQAPTLEKVKEYDLSSLVPAGDNIAGVMVDWQGRLWFTLAGAGPDPASICVLAPANYTAANPGAKCVQFGKDAKGRNELIRNTFALTKEGAYVVSSVKMYGIGAGADGQPYKIWSEPYETINEVKSGQYSLGSGTSPTIVGNGKYVGITDNAEQLHVVVYRTAEKLGPKEQRIVCTVPVFPYGHGADENSLVGHDLSFLAENNYGYNYDFARLEMTGRSEPGFARVDVDPNGKGCSVGWVNDEVASVVSGHLSTRTGLYYTLSRKWDGDVEVYYWTALDWRTGEVAWEKLAGTGTLYDGWYPGVGIANDTLYVGEYGGVVTLKDSD
jgi:hypothetical protein